jgi:hypothetical protein
MIDNNIRKRFILFLFGCIGLRIFMVYFAKTSSFENVKLLAYVTLIISFGFVYLFLSGKRKTGAEIFGDKIWWNNLRPLHAFLYFLFSYNVLVLNKKSWEILALDVIIGFIAFINYHSSVGNFNKIF